MDGLGNLPRALVDGNGRDPLDHQLVTELTVLAALALSGPEALPMGSANVRRHGALPCPLMRSVSDSACRADGAANLGSEHTDGLGVRAPADLLSLGLFRRGVDSLRAVLGRKHEK